MNHGNRNTAVEIVVPVHNRKNLILQCIRSLQRTDQSGLEVHIIVVNDGSTDGTSEAIRQQYPTRSSKSLKAMAIDGIPREQSAA